MSKLLKRTLAFALIFCMLLSVIPAAYANEEQPQPPEIIEYSFSGTRSSLAKNDLYTKENMLNGTNDFYFLFDADYKGWSVTTTEVSPSGINMNNCNSASKGFAVAINVAKPGTYDIALQYSCYMGVPMNFTMVKLTEELEIALTNGYSYGTTTSAWSALSSYHNKTGNAFTVKVEIANGQGVNVLGRAIIPNVTLEEANYALICTPSKTGGSVRLGRLYMAEAGGELLNSSLAKVNTVHLCKDAVWPQASIYGPAGHALNLNGYKLEVAGIAGAAIVDHSAEATGSVVISDRIALHTGNAGYNNSAQLVKQIGVYNATLGAYKFFSNPQIATTPGNTVANPLYDAEADTVQFAAKFITDQGVLDAIAAEGSGFELQMVWQVGEETEKISVLDDETAAAWAAAGADQVLQITLKNVNALSSGTVVKCTPRVVANKTIVSGTTLTFEVP